MKINSEQEMLDFGESFAKKSSERIIELVGDVGAGKTTFVRGLAKGLRIKEPITSPSFTISKTYALPTGGNLIHYDFYRLSNPGIMLDDLNENLKNPENLIVIEWGESISKILPKNHLKINFIYNEKSRELIINDSWSNTFSGASATNGERAEQLSPVTTGTKEHTPKGITQLSIFLDTSAPETILKINNKEYRHDFGHDLAEKLLSFIHDKLKENHQTWQDITEITFMSGPGSFTGLRIGATIVNTLAHELKIPLYDHHGKKHQIIIPDYGHPANISKPRK